MPSTETDSLRSNSSHATLVRGAYDMLAGLETLRRSHGAAEASRLVGEEWTGANPTQSHLADILSQARQQAMIQRQLNEEREQLHHGRLNHEQRVEAGHHYEMLRHAACEYNHLVRGFIEGHREEVDRDDFTQWLTMASAGHHDWANGEITGAISEIALHAALMGLPELKALRYGTLEEDLHGNDFVCEWGGRLVTIDAKTGRYYPLSEHKHGQLHLEISVPRESMDGFRLTRHGLDRLRHDVRRALQESGGVAPHASHTHY